MAGCRDRRAVEDCWAWENANGFLHSFEGFFALMDAPHCTEKG